MPIEIEQDVFDRVQAMKFCKDCLHLETMPDELIGQCRRPREDEFDLVTGLVRPVYANSERQKDMRKDFPDTPGLRETCGPEAKFFVPRQRSTEAA